MKVVAIQKIYRLHCFLHKLRRKILQRYWKNECERGDMPNTYRKRLATIREEIRDGIIDKWLKYAMSDNLNRFMIWRIHLIRQNYTSFA